MTRAVGVRYIETGQEGTTVGIFIYEMREVPGGVILEHPQRAGPMTLTVPGGPLAEFINPKVRAWEREWGRLLGLPSAGELATLRPLPDLPPDRP